MCPTGKKTSNELDSANSHPEFTIRLFRNRDEQKFLALLREFIPEFGRKWYEHWLWQYKNNPFGHFIVVASCDNQIVGAYPTTPVRVKIGDLIVNGCQGTDAIVHPGFRRQGVFSSMGIFSCQTAPKGNMEIFYAFAGKFSHPASLKFGCFDICRVPVLVKILNTRNAISLASLRWKTNILSNRIFKNIANYLFLLFAALRWSPSIFKQPKRIQRTNDIKITQTDSFDKRFDDFWKKASRDYQSSS